MCSSSSVDEATPPTPTPSTTNPYVPTTVSEAPEEPPISFINIQDLIDFQKTITHHINFTYSHLNFMEKITQDIYEMWEMMEDQQVEKYDIYRLLTYYSYFQGYSSLNNWQQELLDNYIPPLDSSCMFCSLPKGYWCDIVSPK